MGCMAEQNGVYVHVGTVSACGCPDERDLNGGAEGRDYCDM